jgi:hypothetical protein
MPQLEWTRLFLDAQGYQVQKTILYQDNKSAMLLERNGRASSSRRTKHIHLRYFYVKDRVDAGAMHIEHCPTEDMLADFFTKPLQGGPFRRMRDRIMNIDPSSPYHSSSHRSVLKGGNDLDDQNDLGDRTEQADLARSQDDLKQRVAVTANQISWREYRVMVILERWMVMLLLVTRGF